MFKIHGFLREEDPQFLFPLLAGSMLSKTGYFYRLVLAVYFEGLAGLFDYNIFMFLEDD